MTDARAPRVQGYVSNGFEPVRDAFIENFVRRKELGAACCVYRHGEKAVDLWGGIRNKATGEPWEEDTLVLVYSTTKGLAAMTLALAHSRGWLDYDKPICAYWPEFAQGGKETITVRQLLAHQAGLFALDEVVDRDLVADLDRLALVLARQTPAWRPGSRQAYHAITLGFYVGELLRRIDPQRRSLGQFFHDEIASPLGLDFFIRLPEQIPDSRLATIENPTLLQAFLEAPPRLTLAMLFPRSIASRALGIGTALRDKNGYYFRNLEVPAGSGVGAARAIARAYGVFATGGRELQLRPETLELLKAPAIPADHGFYDECLKDEIRFSLGFGKPDQNSALHPDSFGHSGSGGSFGGANPEAGIGYAYVTNRMSTILPFDPRDLALRNALSSVINR